MRIRLIHIFRFKYPMQSKKLYGPFWQNCMLGYWTSCFQDGLWIHHKNIPLLVLPKKYLITFRHSFKKKSFNINVRNSTGKEPKFVFETFIFKAREGNHKKFNLEVWRENYGGLSIAIIMSGFKQSAFYPLSSFHIAGGGCLMHIFCLSAQ